MYAWLEEEHGLARRAMSVYERASQAVPEDERLGVFLMYIARAEEFFGVTRTRAIYERAVAALPEHNMSDICTRFADMERQLGEIDRARAIFSHASQYCNPSTVLSLWSAWREFEIQHGNEETFKEMLRTKRSVEQLFSTHNFVAASTLAEASTVASDMAFESAGASSGGSGSGMAVDAAPPPAPHHPAVKKRDRDVSDVSEVSVPAAVYGGIAAKAASEAAASGGGAAGEGALARFKRRRVGGEA